ncbi:sulfate permease [Microbacterium sp. 71-23]|uniref:sulfate permease n=1 Tax=Microbacterium sp. 71-23 TaxID=1895787 RepID=UPI000A423F6A|nr:sulfate permease [Microbacterium sp. 71-23]
MLRLIWIASIHIRYFLRHYAPTNILLDAIRTRRGLKWGIPAMLLAAPYLYAAAICTTIIDQGGPGWLNILVVLSIWDAFKMLWIGPISLVLLVRVRAREYRERRAAARSGEGDQKGTRTMHDMQTTTPIEVA